MEVGIPNRRVVVVFALALVLLVWGTLGFFDRRQFGRGGFTYFDYTINYVNRGGGAERAGLRVGDRVVSVEGIAVETLPLYSRWPRDLSRRAGESLAMVVERDGETLSFAITYEPTPRSIINLRLGVAAIGLSFLVFGLWPLLTVRTPQALALAQIGLAAGLATFGVGPYLGTWDGVASHLQLASLILFSALMLRFFLRFPDAGPIAESRLIGWLVFGPWVLFVGCLVLELAFHPRLYHTFGGPGMFLLLGYATLALAAVIYKLIRTPLRDWWASGLGWILVGLVAALGPSLLMFLGTLMITDLWIPAFNYFPLLVVLIPVTMAVAVRQRAHWAEAPAS